MRATLEIRVSTSSAQPKADRAQATRNAAVTIFRFTPRAGAAMEDAISCLFVAKLRRSKALRPLSRSALEANRDVALGRLRREHEAPPAGQVGGERQGVRVGDSLDPWRCQSRGIEHVPVAAVVQDVD